MEKNVTYKECKEYRNDAYIALEDIINASETALTSTIKSEIRHSEMRTKAYIDNKISEVKADITGLDERITGLDKKVTGLDEKIDALDQKVERHHNELIEAIKSLKS